MYTSSNATSWNRLTAGNSDITSAIAYNNNLYVLAAYKIIPDNAYSWYDTTNIYVSSASDSKGASTGSVVTSNSSSSYPNDGQSGDYWYTYNRSYKSSGVYLNTVGSINSNTYPDNGVGTDGYWYVKQ